MFLIPISPNLSRYNFKWISCQYINSWSLYIWFIFIWKFQTKNFVSDGGSSSSDQMVPKKETRLKLTIKKKDNHQDQTDLPQSPIKDMTGTNSLKWISSKVRLMKKKKAIITTSDSSKQHTNNDQSSNLSNSERQNGYNNDCVIRICSDCNTTKTPLWRSGPRGPKVLITRLLITHICVSFFLVLMLKVDA
jgi:hypothetical protein